MASHGGHRKLVQILTETDEAESAKRVREIVTHITGHSRQKRVDAIWSSWVEQSGTTGDEAFIVARRWGLVSFEPPTDTEQEGQSRKRRGMGI